MPVLLSDLALEMLTIIVEVSTLQSFLKQETVFQIFDIRYFHVVFKLFKSLVGSGIIFIEKNGRWHHRSDLDRNALEYFVSSNSETISYIISYSLLKKCHLSWISCFPEVGRRTCCVLLAGVYTKPLTGILLPE